MSILSMVDGESSSKNITFMDKTHKPSKHKQLRVESRSNDEEETGYDQGSDDDDEG